MYILLFILLQKLIIKNQCILSKKVKKKILKMYDYIIHVLYIYYTCINIYYITVRINILYYLDDVCR